MTVSWTVGVLMVAAAGIGAANALDAPANDERLDAPVVVPDRSPAPAGNSATTPGPARPAGPTTTGPSTAEHEVQPLGPAPSKAPVAPDDDADDRDDPDPDDPDDDADDRGDPDDPDDPDDDPDDPDDEPDEPDDPDSPDNPDDNG